MRLYLCSLLLVLLCKVEFAHAAKPSCYQTLVDNVLVADLGEVVLDFEKYPEKEWREILEKRGIVIPNPPIVLENWGSNSSRVAYNSYLIKQAIGQRLATKYNSFAESFLQSEVGRSLVRKEDVSLRENMPQILLALSASGELPLANGKSFNPLTETRIGKQSVESALRALKLESIDINNERVRDWVVLIKKIIDTKPALWESLKSQVNGADDRLALRAFFDEAGFHTYADHFKHNGWFVDPNLAPTRGQKKVGDVSLKDFFATENAMCCGTSCGNCPLGFPSILKDVQKNLTKRLDAHNIFQQELLRSADTILTEERKVVEHGLSETFRVLDEFKDENFGVFSNQSPHWIDESFRKKILDSQVEFLSLNSDLVRRLYVQSRPVDLINQQILKLLNDPLVKNNLRAMRLREMFHLN